MAGNGMHHCWSESKSESESEDDFHGGELQVDSDGNPKLTFHNYKPSRDELVNELAKKRTLGMTIPQKIKECILPFVTQRNEMIKKIQQLQSSCTSKLVADVKKAIPLKIKSQHTGIKIGRMILEIHSAIKNYMEVTEKAGFRVVHIFSIPFEPLDKAMQSAISNI